MTLHPRLSAAGIEHVKRFEGLRTRSARLENGGWTIGYGHTLSAREGAQVTAAEAEALLVYDLDKIARAIDSLIFTPLNQNQFAALTAFAFNIGLENFAGSAVLKRINEGAMLEAAAALELWRRGHFHGDALVVDGLVRRRAAEKALFLTPPEGFRPVPTPVVRPAFDAGAIGLFAQATGLVDAADLRVPLDGETASAERHEAPLGPATEAARNVAARLQQLYPETPDGPDAVGAEDPAQFPAAQPGADALDTPPEPPPPPFVDPSPAPDAEGFGRRNVDPADARPAAPPRKRPSLSKPCTRVAMLVGLAGAAMFIGALAATLYGRATPGNLALGLLGVICMVPAGLQLLLKLFGEKPPTRRGA